MKRGQESWKVQLGGGFGHEAVSSAMSTPVLSPFMIFRLAHVPGTSAADCSLPWMTPAPPGSLTVPSSPWSAVSPSTTQLWSPELSLLYFSGSPRSLQWPRYLTSRPCCSGSGRHALYFPSESRSDRLSILCSQHECRWVPSSVGHIVLIGTVYT